MQNEKHTPQDPRAPVPHPEKKGESAAINKLTENEDEGSRDDTCGCGGSHSGSGLTSADTTEGTRLEDVSNTKFEDSSRNPEAGKQGKNKNEDENDAENRIRQGNQEPYIQNAPRSRRQLGDPDDDVSAETRRKESLAEDAEKIADEDAEIRPEKKPVIHK